MSFRALIIPEDPRKDEHLLKPIFSRLLDEIRPQSLVEVCRDPVLGGVGRALKWEKIEPIVQRYRSRVRLFILAIDRDGDPDRRAKLDHLEDCAARLLGETDRVFVAEHAWEEVEVWALAGLRDLREHVGGRDFSWRAVRDDLNPKENWFIPYATSRAIAGGPYGGRRVLGREAARAWPRIRQFCPELEALQEKIRRSIG